MRKRIETVPSESTETPGFIYSVDSTMLDKNKVLSIHVRRNSTRIVLPQNKSRKIKTESRYPGPQACIFQK